MKQICVALVVIGALLVCHNISLQLNWNRRLRRCKVTTFAKVLDSTKNTDKKPGKYTVHYEYFTKDRRLEGKQRTNKRFSKDDAVRLRYNPAKPEEQMKLSERRPSRCELVVGAILLIIPGFIVLIEHFYPAQLL